MSGMIVEMALLCLAILWLCQLSRRLPHKLPPGPRPLPFVGNLFSVKLAHMYLGFEQLHIKYGPIVSLDMGGRKMILLGSQRTASDLLDRRAPIYSSRPSLPFFDRYVSQGWHWGTNPDNAHWRASRRLATKKMAEVKQGCSESVQELEACLTAMRIAERPETWMKQLERFPTSTISSLCFGQPLWDTEAPTYVGIRKITDDIVAAFTPGNNLIDVLPIFDYLPDCLAHWRAKGRASHEFERNYHVGLLREVARQGEGAPTSWAKDFLADPARGRLKDTEVGLAYVLADLFIGGADTTTVASHSFVLACLTYPDFISRAQEELELIVGTERMPTFADRPHLPFIEACVRETMRWRPSIPGSIPHMLTQDDVYEAPDGQTYFLPAGALVAASIWTISHDPGRYVEPGRFMPERHLGEKGELKREIDSSVFGHGQRVCVGRPLAERSLFISIATLLWAFDIRPLVDEVTGKAKVYDEHDYENQAMLGPKPFQCQWLLRPERGAVFAREWEGREKDVQKLLSKDS